MKCSKFANPKEDGDGWGISSQSNDKSPLYEGTGHKGNGTLAWNSSSCKTAVPMQRSPVLQLKNPLWCPWTQSRGRGMLWGAPHGHRVELKPFSWCRSCRNLAFVEKKRGSGCWQPLRSAHYPGDLVPLHGEVRECISGGEGAPTRCTCSDLHVRHSQGL